jgi:hypothetical protein
VAQLYPRDMYSVLNCHNVVNDTEFYLGHLQFNVTFTGNAECLKKSFTMVFHKLLCGVERWIVCDLLSVNVFVTLATQ